MDDRKKLIQKLLKLESVVLDFVAENAELSADNGRLRDMVREGSDIRYVDDERECPQCEGDDSGWITPDRCLPCFKLACTAALSPGTPKGKD